MNVSPEFAAEDGDGEPISILTATERPPSHGDCCLTARCRLHVSSELSLPVASASIQRRFNFDRHVFAFEHVATTALTRSGVFSRNAVDCPIACLEASVFWSFCLQEHEVEERSSEVYFRSDRGWSDKGGKHR